MAAHIAILEKNSNRKRSRVECSFDKSTHILTKFSSVIDTMLHFLLTSTVICQFLHTSDHPEPKQVMLLYLNKKFNCFLIRNTIPDLTKEADGACNAKIQYKHLTKIVGTINLQNILN